MLDLEDQLGKARLFARRVVLVPKIASGGAVESAANAFELFLGGRDVAGAERFEEVLNAVADDRASGAVAFAGNNVLSQSFLGALNIRHGSLFFLKLVKNYRLFLNTSQGGTLIVKNDG